MIAVRQPKCIEFLPLAGLTCTRAQHILVACAFDRAQPADLTSDADIEIATKLFGSLEPVPASAFDVIALVAGARGGKSRMCAVAMLWKGLTCDLSWLGTRRTRRRESSARRQSRSRGSVFALRAWCRADRSRFADRNIGRRFVQRSASGRQAHPLCCAAGVTVWNVFARAIDLGFALFDEAAFFRSDEMYQVSEQRPVCRRGRLE